MNRVDIAGVAGSNPAAPTIFSFDWKRLPPAPVPPDPADIGVYPQNTTETCGQNAGKFVPCSFPAHGVAL